MYVHNIESIVIIILYNVFGGGGKVIVFLSDAAQSYSFHQKIVSSIANPYYYNSYQRLKKYTETLTIVVAAATLSPNSLVYMYMCHSVTPNTIHTCTLGQPTIPTIQLTRMVLDRRPR